ncbi:ABC transporter substrate-binding protein [Acidimangrovimonas sediminis]|uniref:ABC transporter substrate-binding protein n=1 Tax=Acidimangrovimonas sediminis TaxID=2056283 RepID=UPI000C8057D6|nr:ABC transporter substrate-binding protein [Acidimangrovimonas sediminis]
MKRLSLLIATTALTAAASAAATAARADITVYTAGPGGLAKALVQGFTKESGIKVNLYQATTGKVMARLKAEQSNPQADVVISASWGTATSFAKQGLLMPYTSPNAAKVPDFLKTDTAVAEGVSALAIAWNPKSGTPRPTDWSDLAKPYYKDKVTMPDPAQSGSAFELVAALDGNGQQGLFGKLHGNGVLVAGANKAALNPVLQGAKAAVFGAVDYISMAAKAKGESVDVIFPESGTVVAPRPMMILKSTTHADEAKKFVDYVLSDAGQAAVAKVYLMPARTDVPAKRPTISELKLLKLDSEGAQAKRAAILGDFAKAMGK